MKIIRRERKPKYESWRKWFAWFPVAVEVASGQHQWAWVWLEKVERKGTLGYGGVSYRYREILHT